MTYSPSDAIFFLPRTIAPSVMEEVLLRPLFLYLLEALRDAGVTRVLTISDEPLPIPDGMFSAVVSASPASFKEYTSAFSGEHPAPVFFISGASFFDKSALLRLRRHKNARLFAMDTPLPLYYAETPDKELLFKLSEGLVDGFESVHEWDEDGALHCASISAVSDFTALSEMLRDRINLMHMENGVRFLSTEAVFIGPDVKIGAGTRILPPLILRGGSVIGENCVLGPNSVIVNSKIGDCTEINASQIYDSVVGAHVKIGPFAYIRPDCVVGDHIKVGDFVELKKAKIGNGTKISHLTYIGDAEVGENVNFGCGTVVVNYDGADKHLTVVGDGAFVGCNTNLVAPVRVGNYAYTAAGTTITEDVPDHSLAIGRARQVNKGDWVRRKKGRQRD